MHDAWGVYAGGTSEVVLDGLGRRLGIIYRGGKGEYALEMLTEMGTSTIANSGAKVK